jgi:hypothetical protein
MRPLPHPPRAEFHDDSAEVLRAWIIAGGLEISIHPSHWKDRPEQWGRLLADAAEHMADAISEETGRSRSEVLKQITDSLRDFLEHPSHDRDGDFLR